MAQLHTDVVIVGAGAAGLMCALTAGARGRRVVVLDHANRAGKKILMSGGGRCNFTNLDVRPGHYLSANPHFVKSALARYTPWDFIAMVDRHGIAWHEKEAGQLFCDDSSKQIQQMLLAECARVGVRIELGCSVSAVETGGPGFKLETTHGSWLCASLVIATGGLSIPSMGATGWGYQLARQFGHELVPTRAALVPLTLSGRPLDDYADLAGLAVDRVGASVGSMRFDGGLLFTHRGLSGPPILQISSYWQPGDALSLDFVPDRDMAEWLAGQRQARPAAELKTVLADCLPRRLAQRLCDLGGGNRLLRQYDAKELAALGRKLQAWPVVASGTEGWRTAEVTLGGVDTRELSSSTMESRRVKGLHFIGEVVDVTGHLGGYNFQWAWASGHAAGEVV